MTNTDIADRINKYTDQDTRVSVKQTERIIQALASDRVLGAAVLVLLKAELPSVPPPPVAPIEPVPPVAGQEGWPKKEVDAAFTPAGKPLSEVK